MDAEIRLRDRLVDRYRAGEVGGSAVLLAASLGHEEALTLYPETSLVDWSNWGERKDAIKESGVDARLLACDYAERVLHVFEEEHPGDDRPREAIRVTRAFVAGEASYAAYAAASSAASASAAAAYYAASDASCSASYAASYAASVATYSEASSASSAAYASYSAEAESVNGSATPSRIVLYGR